MLWVTSRSHSGGTSIEPITSSHYTNEAAAATLAIERQVGPITSAGRSGCAARNGSPWLPRWDPVGPLPGPRWNLAMAGEWLEMVFVGENRGPLGPFTPSHLFLFAAAPSTPSFPSWMRLFPRPSGSASPDAPPAVAGKCSRPSDAIGVAEKGRMAGTETSDSYLEIMNMMEGTRPSLELDAP